MSKKVKPTDNNKEELPGNPEYSAKDDIYAHEERESYLEGDEKDESDEERSLDEGLDIPGAELDDEDELIGEEDEENNYYSLGGDNHDDLEEDNDND
ncbi:MAG: hypothetical protein QM731_08930 [Chitinophagaceae bacterium]